MVTARVRRMTAADLPAVGAMAGKLVRIHHEFDRRRFMDPMDIESGYVAWLASQLGAENAILRVAEDDWGIAGYVYASLEPRSYDLLLDACANVHDVYVDERARHGGVAEALLREALREAASLGAPRGGTGGDPGTGGTGGDPSTGGTGGGPGTGGTGGGPGTGGTPTAKSAATTATKPPSPSAAATSATTRTSARSPAAPRPSTRKPGPERSGAPSSAA